MHNQVIESFERVLHNLWFIKEIFELMVGAAFYFFEAFVRLFIPHCKKDVEGEIVLVTGAANGIGKLIAKELGHHGATLVLWDINSDALDRTAKELKQILDVRVYAYTCDCSRRSDVYRVAELVKREVGDVSILVNNAGMVTGKYSFVEAPDNLVDRTLRVNVAAHFWTYKAFLPAMLQRNHGHLVCVACHGGLFAMNGLADYCASKSAAVSSVVVETGSFESESRSSPEMVESESRPSSERVESESRPSSERVESESKPRPERLGLRQDLKKSSRVCQMYDGNNKG